MGKFWILAGVCAALTAISPPAAAQSRVLAPIDDWDWGKTGEYCGLVRNFGDSESPVRMVIYSYGPQGNYRIVLSGADLPRNNDAVEQGRAAFGNAGDLEDLHVIVGKRGEDGEIALQANRRSGLSLALTWSASDRETEVTIPLDPLATSFTIATPRMEPLTLEIGPMQSALADLATCEGQLLNDWGLDVADAAEVATPASVTNPLPLIRQLRLPPSIVINRRSQIINLRLVIDDDGELADCALQAPNFGEDVADDMCRVLAREGEFMPARSRTGEAVPSLLRVSYMMIIYD